MQTQIKVKLIYPKSGFKKNGKPYTLTKLLATDGKYYSIFKALSEVKVGSLITLKCEPSQGHDNCFDIKEIISYDAHPDTSMSTGKSESTTDGGAPIPKATPAPPTIQDRLTQHELEQLEIERSIEARCDKAVSMANGFLKKHDELDYSLLTEIAIEMSHQLYGEYSIKAIQRSKSGR